MYTRKPSTERSWRTRLHRLLEAPNSSPAAFVIHIVTTFLIVFSAVVTILETLPLFHSRGDRVWFGIETSIVALFTVEYVARVLAWSTSWSSFLGWFSCELPRCFSRQRCSLLCRSVLRNHRPPCNLTVLYRNCPAS